MKCARPIALATLLACACRRDEVPARLDASAAPSASSHVPSGAERAPWPPLPTNAVEARALVEAKTLRSAGEPLAELDAAELDRRLRSGIESGRLVAGAGSIDAVLAVLAEDAASAGRSFYLLFGTYHDAPAQVEAFRRLTGPLSQVPWTLVVAEQLRADGRWAGIEHGEERGDDDALLLYRNTGSRTALAAIEAAQARDDYAAWKFGYVDSVVGIVSDARAAGRTIGACDMPISLQAMLGEARAEHARAVRELHCALAITDALAAERAEALCEQQQRREPPAVAILWGASHVGPDGFARFLSPDATVLPIRVVGGRPAASPDAEITERFDVVDPVLLLGPPEVRGSQLALPEKVLLMPDTHAERHFERKRVKGGADEGTGVAIASAVATEIWIDGRAIAVGPKPRFEALSVGAHALAAPRGKRTLLASLVVMPGGFTELRLETTEPEVTMTIHAP